MTAITIEDLPDDVLRAVQDHAYNSGRSVLEYLRDLIFDDAAHPQPAGTPSSRQSAAETDEWMRQTRVSANNPEFQKWTAEQRAKFPPKENESRGYRAARLLCGTVYNPHGLTTEQLMEQVRGG